SERRALQVAAPRMVGEVASLEPAAPEVDRALEPPLAVLDRFRRNGRGPPGERCEALLPGLHPVAGSRVGAVDSQAQVAGVRRLHVAAAHLRIGAAVAPPLPLLLRPAVVEGGLAAHLDVHLTR